MTDATGKDTGGGERERGREKGGRKEGKRKAGGVETGRGEEERERFAAESFHSLFNARIRTLNRTSLEVASYLTMASSAKPEGRLEASETCPKKNTSLHKAFVEDKQKFCHAQKEGKSE